MPPVKLVKASIFAALAIGVGYALLMVPNVELITTIVFCAGLWLGISWGIVVGFTAEFIFSAMHPFGSGLAFPPMLAAQVIGMALVGMGGGLARPFIRNWGNSIAGRIALGAIGYILTLVFDSLTTLSYPVSAGFDWPQIKALYISGLGFTFLHQFSNAIIFAVGLPVILRSAVFRDELSESGIN